MFTCTKCKTTENVERFHEVDMPKLTKDELVYKKVNVWMCFACGTKFEITDKQAYKIEKTQISWAKSGTIYDRIVLKDKVVYMVLGNGTALSIAEDSTLDWVVKGWD